MSDKRRKPERLGGIPPCPDKELMRNAEESELRNGVAVIGISRHRLGTDGKGVTTLVAFHGCPLRCKHCLNKECWEPEERFKRYTPQSLYDEVKVDDLYLRATGGGITFGGGEPCLQADFIVSQSELREMADELADRGTVYFRWGGFPHHELQFPIEGEKVVMVHSDEDSEILYLMRVLAAGDDCARYVEDPDSIHCVDDCAPFVLTNVMGPVRIKKTDWPFLSGVDMCGFSATEYVHEKLSWGFNGIFKRQLLKTLNRNNVDMDPSIDEPIN